MGQTAIFQEGRAGKVGQRGWKTEEKHGKTKLWKEVGACFEVMEKQWLFMLRLLWSL